MLNRPPSNPTDRDRRRRADRDRQRRRRQREALGLKPYQLEAHEHRLAHAMIASEPLTTEKALQQELVERELAKLVADFIERWDTVTA
jgi:hypothetical protein